MKKNIGFIGLGIMGKPMAKNLLKAGYPLFVFDIVEAAVAELAEAGATGCESIADVTASCDTIVTMLPNSPHVKTVVLGKGGVAESAKAGTLIVDMSSIAPMASKEIQVELVKKNLRMVDAPVSGGEPKAVDGTLAIMVGGDEADYEEAKPLFEIMGGTYVLVGPIGSGNTCKLANQVIVACNIAALSEGLLLAQMAGTDPEKVFNAINGGLAGSTVMNAKAPMILSGNFKPGFKIDLHIKDLQNALDTAGITGTPLMLTAEVMQMMQHLHRAGEGQSDHSAVMKFYEKLADTEVRKD